ncbi:MULTISPECIES: FISUMP domain-containing protein [unclassified Fusibacter]|uniref:FISUMP domain-containing protein n=1 Tax=unclassified Fusibacter TaxID=2624464 RepID=UPI001010D52F|nr:MULTISPECIES: FISUMP domain-containing protein [unclassified Fusibacter]MCK8061034.1 fibrobacter succinogenes major paralogous domain-containing protein [Fusibacter sp. A2]NPE20512.1 hypothetical protein [Fusibacter sp. A1]RXV63712.1 hypothetical protein DWB64_01675 [Fusibacter sp. A1]
MKRKLIVTLFFIVMLFILSGCGGKLAVSDTTVHASEALAKDGSVTLHITGGKKPYAVKWLDGSTELVREGLPSGRYIITVSDAREEKIVTEVVVEEPTTGIMTTEDGLEYGIVKIGDQWWMAENFRGTSSPLGTPLHGISYEDKSETNGLLYNYEDAVSGAPDGWHLATDMDFMRLEYLYGMTEVDAEEVGTQERGTYQGLLLHPGGETGFDSEFYGWYGGDTPQFEGYGEFVKYWADSGHDDSEGDVYSRVLVKNRDDIGKFIEEKESKMYVRYVYGPPAKSID